MLVFFAQTANAIQAKLKHHTFYAKGDGTYTDLHLQIATRGLKADLSDIAKPVYKVNATVSVTQGDKLIHTEKFMVEYGIDSRKEIPPAILAAARVYLEEGRYSLLVELRNVADLKDNVTAVDSLIIKPSKEGHLAIALASELRYSGEETLYQKESIAFTPDFRSIFKRRDSIQLFVQYWDNADLLKKGGDIILRVDGIPLGTLPFVPTKGKWFEEVYTLPISAFPVNAQTLTCEIKTVMGKSLAMEELMVFVEEERAAIAQRVEKACFDTSDRVLAKRVVSSLYPIMNGKDRQFMTQLTDKSNPASAEIYSAYYSNYWLINYGASGCDSARAYETKVATVEEFKAGSKPGFATDRGRVYLQYGPPNERTLNTNDPSAFPYEVWSYYQAGSQRNVKFIFYEPSSVINDYQLLHSDVFGEPQQPQWQVMIHRRTDNPRMGADNNEYTPHYGDKLNDAKQY
jgi:GWxTD domain-containing protein